MAPRIIDLIPSQHGHFRLESGYHAEFTLDTETFLESEPGASRLSALAERIERYSPTAICGPTEGGLEVVARTSVRAHPPPPPHQPNSER
jgi:orotate phosphoribosyltransferase